MQSAVRFQVEYWNSEGRDGIKEGDVFVSNHPQLAGGSHLPDSEFWTIPVECIFFVNFIRANTYLTYELFPFSY
jgi:N-methylhydantoinase B/oxoprolinase/acetone carboxylase alpha subunit